MTRKNGAYQDSNSDCFSRVRRSAGLSIPGRDTDCMSCSVFICALRSLYSTLKSIPLHCLLLYESNVLIASLRLMTKFLICRMDSFAFRLVANVTSKNCAYRDSNSDCLFRVRCSAGLSIPGRDTDCMSCSVFICALRSLYSALKSIPLQYYEIISNALQFC